MPLGARMLTDEEQALATSGRGVEIAAARMSRAQETGDPMRSVADLLDAIDALSLHLAYIEASADAFGRGNRYAVDGLPDGVIE